ncbi:hypothetical protein JAAARDRAFT_31401 [Jaapia argillacea MUCL 33604]|uniref:CNH domain-containing protein n=1 Tax=Jaapia argillacea MUCL 33604 TaxID=933084 RepID=A0A067QEK7_9AGAM|nr:hypothetical protein JAAARDRAFT_31401 [Jaapia argillacea MUCL 33604]
MNTPTIAPFELEVLMTETLTSAASDFETAESEVRGLTVEKRVECSAPFKTSDGRQFIAIGDSEGVWIGLQSDPSSIRPVLHKKFVNGLGVLDDEGWLIVLSAKTLYAYRIESLIPPPSESSQDHPATLPEMLSKDGEVEFFRIGRFKGRSCIICMTKEGTDSNFRVWKPASSGVKFFSWLKKKSGPFVVSRDFCVLCHAYDVEFLVNAIAVLCDRGFEIMKVTKLKCTTIPDCDELHLEELSERIGRSKPLALCRHGETSHLLCYSHFGLSVDNHGTPTSPLNIVEWENAAESVAFHPPYVLLFSGSGVEIRHMESGVVVQRIRGSGVKCTWKLSQQTLVWDGKNRQEGGDVKVHGVWNSTVSVDPPRPLTEPDGGAGAASVPQRVHLREVFQLRLRDPGNEESSADDKEL